MNQEQKQEQKQEIGICRSYGGFEKYNLTTFGVNKMREMGYTFGTCDAFVPPRPSLKLPKNRDIGTALRDATITPEHCSLRTNPDILRLLKTYPKEIFIDTIVHVDVLPRKAYELGFYNIHDYDGCETLEIHTKLYKLHCSGAKFIQEYGDTTMCVSDKLVKVQDYILQLEALILS